MSLNGIIIRPKDGNIRQARPTLYLFVRMFGVHKNVVVPWNVSETIHPNIQYFRQINCFRNGGSMATVFMPLPI